MLFSAISRTCRSATTLNTKACGPVAIEEGTVVMGDSLTVHFDEKIWGEDAAEFRPER